MKRKLCVLVLALASVFIFLPNESRAADQNSSFVNNLEYGSAFQRGRGRGRGWDDWRGNRGWNRYRMNRGRTVSVNRRGFRLVRQSFWRNGRRHTRTVRVYY